MKYLFIIVSFHFSLNIFAQPTLPGKAVYANGIIKPNHKTAQQLNDDLTLVYTRWKNKYLHVAEGTTDQYYIKCRNSGAVTVSEGHGYGMVILAYMAWFDKDAHTGFDGMVRYFKANPSNGNKHLMCWQQSLKSGKLVSTGGSAATDGDMDIAYAFLLADKVWGSKGAINYKAEGLQVIRALTESVVHTKYKTLKMGDWAGKEGRRVNDGTRPSDYMLQHMRAYQKATGDKIWATVIDSTYGVINHIFTNYSPQTGLLPDFAERKDGQFIPAIGQLLEDKVDGSDSYNAARFPWRLATDYIVSGNKQAYEECKVINAWIQKTTGGDPAKVSSGYYLDGKPLPGRNYQDLSFQSPFMVSAMTDKANQQWLNKLWDNAVKKYDSYFGDTITMQCMIIASGNWWAPE